MKTRWILVGLIFCSIMLSGMASAENQYYGIDGVYYNDEKLIGDAAKPTLKIGEPFTVKIEMTLNQPSTLGFKLGSLGDNMYEVIEGPSEFKRTKYFKLIDEGTHTFEWTLRPTDGWAGGTLPVNFWYQINMPGEDESVVNSEFTIAVPYITTEYYEGDPTPTTTTDPESPTSADEPTTPSTPAFTLFAAALALSIVARRN
ncbi:MAG: sarcinarray family MAST domain-containing protein [Methanosarcinaceae archaeon]|nr:sarcinarray family MAST domain-containing protein [Methanosarcinaceae archaeon]